MSRPERARKGESLVLALAALMLAASSATPAAALTTAAPWWEKVTFTISGDGSFIIVNGGTIRITFGPAVSTSR